MSNNNEIPNLRLAREITEHFFREDGPYHLGQDAFYMFLVSKFILLKERIIKKDTIHNTLHYDNRKYRLYTNIILDFYNQIKKSGSFQMNSTTVELSDEQEAIVKPELKEAIWCFNKVRDSLAHGSYKFDFDNKCVVINDTSVKYSYSLNCRIPFDLLGAFSFLVDNNIEETEGVDLKKLFEDYKEELSNDFDIDTEIFNHIGDVVVYCDTFSKFGGKEWRVCKNETKGIVIKDKDENEIKEERKLIFSGDKFVTSRNKSKESFLHTQSLILEMQKLLGLDHSCKNPASVVSLYNYMSLVFSQKQEIDYSKLRLDSVQIAFIESENMDEDQSQVDQNYSQIVDSIRDMCDFIYRDPRSQLEDRITNYKKYPCKKTRDVLINYFLNFYLGVVEKIGNRNKIVVDSIRNAVEHGNYGYHESGQVVMYDQTDQNDDRSIKCIVSTPPKDLFHISKQIEDSKNRPYLIGDFQNQLKNLLDEELFQNTWGTLNKISNLVWGRDLDLNCSIEDMLDEINQYDQETSNHEAIINVISDHYRTSAEDESVPKK